MMDLTSRGAVNPESETFAYEQEALSVANARAAEELLESAPAELESGPSPEAPAEPSTGH